MFVVTYTFFASSIKLLIRVSRISSEANPWPTKNWSVLHSPGNPIGPCLIAEGNNPFHFAYSLQILFSVLSNHSYGSSSGSSHCQIATISLGSPVRAAMRSEEIARGTVSGRCAAMSLSLDKGGAEWDPLSSWSGRVWSSSVCALGSCCSAGGNEWVGEREVALRSGTGGNTQGRTDSFFLKNDAINVACAWDPPSLLLFCCNSWHRALPM
jgi:hypothetical protein